MAAKYTKAPISELVFGVFLNKSTLIREGVFFELLSELKNKFPTIISNPATAQQILINNSIHQSIDYDRSGFTMYRLFNDHKRQIMLQQNFLTYHWVRNDNEPVGEYPGYKTVYNEFIEIFNIIKKISLRNNWDIFQEIDYYYLAYNDRINLNSFIQNGKKISDIINVSDIIFNINNKIYRSNNIIGTFSTVCDEVNGYVITQLNSPTYGNEQILMVDNKIDGIFSNKEDIESWFNIAHDIQISIFENLFNADILKSWK